MFSKYLELIKRAFINRLAYRSELTLWFVLDTIPLLVLLLVWMSVYAGQTEIKGYSLADMLNYYFLGLVINGVTASHFESHRVQEIRDGKIDYFLTRPLPYLSTIFFSDIGAKAVYWSIILPLYLLLYFILRSVMPLDIEPVSWLAIGQFMILLMTSYLIEFLLALIIVLSGFWIEGAEGLEHFKWVIITLFSGWMIPVAFMPVWLRTITTTLPFQYMYFKPISIMLGQATLQWHEFGYLVVFIASLLALALLIWRQAIYSYSSSGG